MKNTLDRRDLLSNAWKGMTALALGPNLLQISTLAHADTGFCLNASKLGALGKPDQNGVRLPPGFSSRIIAESGVKLDIKNARYDYTWHRYPDGGACYPSQDEGWIYVSNAEAHASQGGGAGAIRFDADGEPVDAYRILGGTHQNCSGGPTLSETWLSCEETSYGRVWECDIHGRMKARARPALGAFKHEAVALDTQTGYIYMTEDESDGCLYRFVPHRFREDGQPSLTHGDLEVALVDHANQSVQWQTVPAPNPKSSGKPPTRKQVTGSTRFSGGEGIWYVDDKIYFATKGDNRIWALDTRKQYLSVVYDKVATDNPILSGVDSVSATSDGQLLIGEDGGSMQIVVIDRELQLAPLLQVMGQHTSEITGPALNPQGTKLYFSSQRGGKSRQGLTYEISGPFRDCLAKA